MLKEAAKKLKINYSTAKTILRLYRREKRIFRKYRILVSQSEKGIEVDSIAHRIKEKAEALESSSLFNLNILTNQLDTLKRKISYVSYYKIYEDESLLHSFLSKLNSDVKETILQNLVCINNLRNIMEFICTLAKKGSCTGCIESIS